MLLETADALTVQDFCTENPKVGCNELVWEELFRRQFPGLHAPFFEVFAAYQASEAARDARMTEGALLITAAPQPLSTETQGKGYGELIATAVFNRQFQDLCAPIIEDFAVYKASEETRGTRLPLSAHMTERVPMFWRDCWQSFASLPDAVMGTVEHLVNGEYGTADFPAYLADVSLICESHWTLAAVLGSMDSSCRCVVPVMLCCAQELLSSVFFYQDSVGMTLRSLLDGGFLTERGAYFILNSEPPICNDCHSVARYCIERGFNDNLPRLIALMEPYSRLSDILHLAINSGQEETALMIAKDVRFDMEDPSYLIEASGAGLSGLVSFILEQKGPVLLRGGGYASAVTGSVNGHHMAVLRSLMEYSGSEFWRNSRDFRRLLGEAITNAKGDMEIVRVLLEYAPHLDIEVTYHWLGLLFRDDRVHILRLLLSNNALGPVRLSELLRTASDSDARECILLILETGGPLMNCDNVLNRALRANKFKLVRLLLDDGRANPMHCGARLMLNLLATGKKESLDMLLKDKRVESELPMTNDALLFISVDSSPRHELIDECLDKAIENLKAGRIELNEQLCRLQLKELARRLGHVVHAGMGRRNLISLISPKQASEH